MAEASSTYLLKSAFLTAGFDEIIHQGSAFFYIPADCLLRIGYCLRQRKQTDRTVFQTQNDLISGFDL